MPEYQHKSDRNISLYGWLLRNSFHSLFEKTNILREILLVLPIFVLKLLYDIAFCRSTLFPDLANNYFSQNIQIWALMRFLLLQREKRIKESNKDIKRDDDIR